MPGEDWASYNAKIKKEIRLWIIGAAIAGVAVLCIAVNEYASAVKCDGWLEGAGVIGGMLKAGVNVGNALADIKIKHYCGAILVGIVGIALCCLAVALLIEYKARRDRMECLYLAGGITCMLSCSYQGECVMGKGLNQRALDAFLSGWSERRKQDFLDNLQSFKWRLGERGMIMLINKLADEMRHGPHDVSQTQSKCPKESNDEKGEA